MKKIPELRQPAIPGLVDGALDPDSVPNGAQVSVFYDDMLRDDQVELRWITSSPAASFVEARAVQADGAPLNFTVPYPVLDAGRGLTATVDYTAVRNSTARQSYAQTAPIRSTPAGWPPPRILDATGSDANPFNPIKPLTDSEENKATVIITDARLKPTDLLAVVWRSPGNAQQSVYATLSAGEARADIPREFIATSLAKTVSIAYVVWRDGDVSGTWEALAVTVLPLAPSALPQPIIIEAQGSVELDVTGLSGDATINIARWPFITIDQIYWLEARGTLANDTPITFALADGAPVSSLEGVTCALALDRLKTLKNGSNLTLAMAVALPSKTTSPYDDEKIDFPLRTYAIKVQKTLEASITTIRDSTLEIPPNGSTPDTEITLTGTGPAGKPIVLYDKKILVGSTSANESGSWDYTITNLTLGHHDYTAVSEFSNPTESEPYSITCRVKTSLHWDFNDMTLQGWVPQNNYADEIYINIAHIAVAPTISGTKSYAGPVILTSISLEGGRSYEISISSFQMDQGPSRVKAQLRFEMNGVPITDYFTPPTDRFSTSTWIYTASFAGYREVAISNATSSGEGNDFMIDKIDVREI